MNYVSTRGQALPADFEQVLTAGLAPDGGLYMPVSWPNLSQDVITGFRQKDYATIAASVLSYFTGDTITRERLSEITRTVYAGFHHEDVAPLAQVGDEDWILELFHGPTLAFKDFAMQLLGALFDEVLKRRGERLTIIAATSGDTGAAAIHALAPCENVDIVVLHPEGRVTDVQRKMMTTIEAPNVLNIAVKGDFDDCQAIVKQLFADDAFKQDVRLSGVNSINWARLAAQTVYYFTALASLPQTARFNFVVPTGNFGDVFAGYVAKKMGLPIGKLGVATNSNDILHRALSSGDYTPAGVTPTSSPSMDIQVASNFERLLYDAGGQNPDDTRALMEVFAEKKACSIPAAVLTKMREDFVSYAANEADTKSEMACHYKQTGTLIDPHTAVARVAAQKLRETGAMTGPIITLSTAHPAKFPEAVTAATGKMPTLPDYWDGLNERREFMDYAPADPSHIAAMISARFKKV